MLHLIQISESTQVIEKAMPLDITSGSLDFGQHETEVIIKPNGDLVYVVPTSMNNGNDFRKLREYIIASANIENIIMFELILQ